MPSAARMRVPRRARVLVIDDDPRVAATIDRMLRREHDVTVITDGVQAQELLGSGGVVDVVLLDLMMPGMSGMELVGWIEKERPDLRSRVAIVTGGCVTLEAEQFLASTWCPCLNKPFTLTALNVLVRHLLANRVGD